jgi:hypothetical protein
MYITLLFLKYSVKHIIIYSMQQQMHIEILVSFPSPPPPGGGEGRKLKYFNITFAAARVV